MFFGDGGDFFEREDVAERVADGFAVDDLGVGLDGTAEVFGVGGVNERDVDADAREGVCELRDGAAIQCSGGYDVVARLTEGEDGGHLRGVT